MGFYELSKKDRDRLVKKIQNEIEDDILNNRINHIIKYFSDSDTYIRKAAYLSIGKIYKSRVIDIDRILSPLNKLINSEDELIRQSVINSAGEIGIYEFFIIEHLMESGLQDNHHKVRNAVIGSLKKAGKKNPGQIFKFSKKYIHHPDPEIRRQICHGIELRGRTHPEEVLPYLKELQYDKSKRVADIMVHVVGQISYKKGCLVKVVDELLTWENKVLTEKCLNEILSVHKSYEKFSAKSVEEAERYVHSRLNKE